MATLFLTKQAAEMYTIAVDFVDKLDTNRSVSFGTVTAIDLYDNTDVSSTVLETSAAVVSGTKLSKGIKAGQQGHRYKLTFLATLDNADKLEEDVFMLIEN